MASKNGDRGFFRLIADLPRELSDLVRAEVNLLQKELASKLRAAGVGLGLLTLGVTLLCLFLVMLVVTLILVLAIFMPAWVAALVVAGTILLVAAVLIFAGVASIKKGFTPFESVDQIASDLKSFGRGGVE